METIGIDVKNGKRSVCYEARGRVFESPRAYQTFVVELVSLQTKCARSFAVDLGKSAA